MLGVGGGTGQSYVALSRAASLEGLQVLRFDPKKASLGFVEVNIRLTNVVAGQSSSEGGGMERWLGSP